MRSFKDALRLGLRALGLLKCAGYVLFGWRWLRCWKSNREFIRRHPDFTPPPAWELYDATAHVDYEGFHRSGVRSARQVAELVRDLGPPGDKLRIVEWGCGPCRCLQHMRTEIPGAVFTGCDYNPRTIAWCRSRVQGASFIQNGLTPPLSLQDGSADVVYVLSVFTHLSEANGQDWMCELHRVLAPGGIVIFTTRGMNYLPFLSAREQSALRGKGIVAISGAREGKKYFLSHHNPTYVKSNLLNGFDLLKHLPAEVRNEGQDIWVARRSDRQGDG